MDKVPENFAISHAEINLDIDEKMHDELAWNFTFKDTKYWEYRTFLITVQSILHF